MKLLMKNGKRSQYTYCNVVLDVAVYRWSHSCLVQPLLRQDRLYGTLYCILNFSDEGMLRMRKALRTITFIFHGRHKPSIVF